MRRAVFQNSPRLLYQDHHLNLLLASLVREGESGERRLSNVIQLRDWLKQLDQSKVTLKLVAKVTLHVCRSFVWRNVKELRSELSECIRLLGKNLSGMLVMQFIRMLRIVVDPEEESEEEQILKFKATYPSVPDLSLADRLDILKPFSEVIHGIVAVCPETAGFITNELAILLSHTHAIELYIVSLNCINGFVPQYADLLSDRFADLVDVAFGWYLSTTIPHDNISQRMVDDVHRHTEQFLLSIHPLWRGNPNSVITWLNQFSEDFLATLENFKTTPDSSNLKKMVWLLEACKVVSDAYSKNRLSTMTNMTPELSELLLSRLLSAVITTTPGDDSTFVMTVWSPPFSSVQANELLCATYSSVASIVLLIPPTCLVSGQLSILHQFISKGVTIMNTRLHISSSIQLLRLIAKTVECSGNRHSPVFSECFRLFDMLPQINSPRLLEGVAVIAQQVFAAKQADVTRELYGRIAAVLKSAYGNRKVFDSAAEQRALFCLASLSKIATDKLDLFGVHLFSPTIFQLLAQCLRVNYGSDGNEVVLKMSPARIRIAIFRLLLAHMQGHGYFAIRSDIIQPLDAPDRNMASRQTSTSLSAFIDILVDAFMLEASSLPFSLLLEMVGAIKEITNQLVLYGGPAVVLKHPKVVQLHQSCVGLALAVPPEQCQPLASAAVTCLAEIMSSYSKGLSLDFLLDIFRVSTLHLHTSNKSVANRCHSMLDQLAVSLDLNILYAAGNEIETFSRDYMKTPRVISHASFSAIMAYLTNVTSARPKLNLIDVNSLSASSIARFAPYTWQMACVGLANFCIANKLRTPLGKAQDTLLAIEMKLNASSEQQQTSPVYLIKAITLLDQNRRLLDVFDHLDRAMYNAYEGTAYSALPSKPARLFFSTNRATCEEWLSRSRYGAMQAAFSAGALEASVRQGFELLVTARSTSSRLANSRLIAVAICLARCFVRLNCSQFVDGMIDWLAKFSGDRQSSTFAWLRPAITFSLEKYEQCIKEVDENIDSLLNSGTPDIAIVVDFLIPFGCDSFDALHDWDGFLSWRAALLTQKLVGHHELLVAATTMLNLSYFDDVGNFQSFNFSDLPAPSDSLANATSFSWKFDDVVRSIQQENMRFIAKVYENRSGGAVDVPNWSKSLTDLTNGLIKVSIVSSGFPSVCNASRLAITHIGNSLGGSNVQELSNTLTSIARIHQSECFSRSMDLMTLTKIHQHLTHSFECSEHCTASANVVRLARKRGLVRLADQLLLAQLQNHVYILTGQLPPETPELCLNALSSIAYDRCPSVLMLNDERLKLLWQVKRQTEALDSLLAFLLPAVQRQLQPLESAKCLSLLAKWLQADEGFAGYVEHLDKNSELYLRLQALRQIMDQTLPLSKLSLGHVMTSSEHLAGELLSMSANHAPSQAKAWLALGQWCHTFGKKALSDASANGLQLTNDELQTVIKCLPPVDIIGQVTFDRIVATVSKVEAPTFVEDVNAGASIGGGNVKEKESDYQKECAAMERKLTAECPLLASTPEARLVIQAVWRAARQRLFTLFNMAAVAYFSYLNLERETTEETTLACLRLLRVLSKHAWELEAILDRGFQDTPVTPWKVIIPQLFARLGHPEPYVRRAISQLLFRIALAAPHEIIFPAIAGLNSYKGTNLPELVAYQHLLDSLASQNANLVSQASDFVAELTRIAVLWDEVALNVLLAHQGAISKHFDQLDAELDGGSNSASSKGGEIAVSIARWKHSTILRPVLELMEAMRNLTTSRPPETDHERWFTSTVLPLIDQTTDALREPKHPGRASARHAQQAIKELLNALQCGSVGLQQAGTGLNLEFLSPLLVSKFSNADGSIPLPGNSTSLFSVQKQLHVLPTKTKPKKITFVGVDGKLYTYLLKGIEDLHLDERMMQLLRVVNSTLTKEPGCRARHYPVTPLGCRVGIIQWVPEVTSLFSIYKRWQQRAAAKTDPPQTVMRPTELYLNRLAKRLGCPSGVSPEQRRSVPQQVQRRILEELMSETPNELFYREIWSSCVNSADWFRKLIALNKSIATMSIVGYTIGLGDRHLDNILLDMTRAEVVHIDYNVCFEKGQLLHIPELVPFRMTHNIETALGAFGCDGLFRSTCEIVMSKLRNSRELLLTLLEAFIYDPLIEWTLNVDEATGDAVVVGGVDHLLPRRVVIQLHKSAAVGMTSSSSTSRSLELLLADYRCHFNLLLIALFEHRNEVRSITPELINGRLDELQKMMIAVQSASQEFADAESKHSAIHDSIDYVKNNWDRLLSLPDRINRVESANELVSHLKRGLETGKPPVDCASTCNLIARAAGMLQLPKIVSSLLSDELINFLQTSGQLNVKQQLENLEDEFSNYFVGPLNDFLVNKPGAVLALFSGRFASNSSQRSDPDKHLYAEVLAGLEDVLNGREDVSVKSLRCITLAQSVSGAIERVLPWTDSDFLLERWMAIRRRLIEASTKASQSPTTSSNSTDSPLALEQALSLFCGKYNSGSNGAVESNGVGYFPAAVAAESISTWLALPLTAWLPACHSDELELFAPNAAVEFLLTLAQTAGTNCDLPTAGVSELLLQTTTMLNLINTFNLAVLELSLGLISVFIPNCVVAILSGQLRLDDDFTIDLTNIVSLDQMKLVIQKPLSCLSEMENSVFNGEERQRIEDLIGWLPTAVSRAAITFSQKLVSYAIGPELDHSYVPTVIDAIRSLVTDYLYDETGPYSIAPLIRRCCLQLCNVFQIASMPTDAALATRDDSVKAFEILKATYVSTKVDRYLELTGTFLRADTSVLSLTLDIFEWCNCGAVDAFDEALLVQPSVKYICSQLMEVDSTFAHMLAQINDFKTRLSEISNSVSQRLKWASGANSALQDVATNFQERRVHLESEMNLVDTNLMSLRAQVNEWLVMLAKNSPNVRLEHFQATLLVISKIKECLANDSIIADAELQLLQHFPCGQQQAPKEWLGQLVRVLNASLALEEPRLLELADTKQNLVDSTLRLIGFAQNHFKRFLEGLVAKFVGPLRALKCDEEIFRPPDARFSFASIADTAVQFIEFASKLGQSDGMSLLADPTVVLECHHKAKLLLEELTVFDEIVNCSDGIEAASSDWFQQKIGNFLEEKIASGPVNQQQDQTPLNQQAVSIWRRVRAKLEGRHYASDPRQRFSIVEHVQVLLSEARDPNNLARMYEGWTPWV